MKKILMVSVFAVLFAVQAFAAAYVIVLKDGTRYNAKAKWVIQNGKAIVTLLNGQTLAINPNEIDVAKTDQVNKLGMGDVKILGQEQQNQQPPQNKTPSIGSMVRIRRPEGAATTTAPTPTPTVKPTTGSTAPAAPNPIADELDAGLKDKFERAYENVGVYEHKLTGTNRNIRVELTADNEDKVFGAISATAFLISRNAAMDTTIDMVELFMKTTNGGAAGRFQISRQDAEAIDKKAMSIQDYFVRKVIY